MAALITSFTSPFFSAGILPCTFGPRTAADVLSDVLVVSGQAISGGSLKNYTSCTRPALEAACSQRGLASSGTHKSDVFDRLVRSDSNTLVPGDMAPMHSVGPLTDLDTSEYKVSNKNYAQLKAMLSSAGQLPDGLPAISLAPSNPAKKLALLLMRQFTAFALLHADPGSDGTEGDSVPGDGDDDPEVTGAGRPKKRRKTSDEIQLELNRQLALLTAHLFKPGQAAALKKLMLPGGGAFQSQAKAMASVVLTQLIEQGTPLDAGAVITQIVEMLDDGSGGAGVW